MMRTLPKVPSQAAELAELKLALAKAEAQNLTLETMLAEALIAYDRQQRAFHHRVKNSLQIIQSYLALTRRERMPDRNINLVEAEARVLVISGAYRLGLGEGKDNHLCVKAFIDQIVINALQLLATPQQHVSASSAVATQMALDQAIPIGLAIVEAAIGGLSGAPHGRLALTCTLDERQCLRIMLGLSGTGQPLPAPSRIILGLQAQIGAQTLPLADGVILNWRISPAASLASAPGELD